MEAYLDDAFASHRNVVGHLPQATLSPHSLEELLYSKRPDIVVFGPGLSVEQAYAASRETRAVFPNIPLVLLFSRENYSLRVLRRFERLSKALFAWDEPSARLIHTLLETKGEAGRGPRGRLVTISGVKGGVGVSSYVAALAHAAQATNREKLPATGPVVDGQTLGMRAVVVDLSPSAALLHYLGCPKLSSPEYGTILSDRLQAQRDLVERMITRAPNGIALLLPPSGGREMRELWLRDLERFQLSLQVVEVLRELYDLVLVDVAGAEGILPYALASQADARVLLASNAPPSVHLLQQRLLEEQSFPGHAKIFVALTLLLPSGLTETDIHDFILKDSPVAHEVMFQSLPALPLDKRAQHWMGTGNSLYTEGNKNLQSLLRQHIESLFGREVEENSSQKAAIGLSRLWSHAQRYRAGFSHDRKGGIAETGASGRNTVTPMRPQRRLPAPLPSEEITERKEPTLLPSGDDPQLLEARGSASLEYALFLGGAALLAVLSLPDLFQSLAHFVSHFSDGG